MRVVMYSTTKFYGFVADGNTQVFFHLESFRPGDYGEPFPPPLCGEDVLVEYTPGSGMGGKAPRALWVDRVKAPDFLHGVVETFNEQRGWGFIQSDAGENFYLHRSEVKEGRMPLAGRRVSFYRGFREGRPRACFICVET